jgi:tetratricopeptide (TPR) repeat protein
VDDVIDRGMAKDPDDRWPSAAEFVERLDEALAPPPRRDRGNGAMGAGTAPTRKLPTRERQRDRTPPPPSRPPRAAAAADRPGRPGPAKGAAVAVLAALLLAAALAFALLSGGDGNDQGANSERRATPTATAKKKETATPTAEQTQEPTATATATETPAASGGEPAGNNARQLQLQAFNLNNQGKSDEALPFAQKAVKLSCKGGAPVNPCGYALYELGRAQRATGDPKAAVKTLEERLRRYPDDQRSTVEAELKKAKADAGQD